MQKAILLVLALIPSVSWSQLQGPIAAKPVGSMYARDFSQARLFKYIQRLSKAFELEGGMMTQMANMKLDDSVEFMVGSTMFLRTGFPPSQESLTFFEADSFDAAKELIRKQSEQFGQDIEIEAADEPDCFLQRNVFTNDLPIPEGTKAKDYLKTMQTAYASMEDYSVSLEEVDGKQVIRTRISYEQRYRYFGGLVYQSQAEDLFTMELPERSQVVTQFSPEHDMGIEAHFDRIPDAFKQLGWNLLSSTAGTQMQQRDEEPSERSDFRRAAYQTGLDIVKAAMFEVTKAYGWLQLANEDRPFVQGELSFDAKPESQLRQQLNDLSSARSRFAPILKGDAALTLHGCVRITESAADVLKAAEVQVLFERTQPGFPAPLTDAAGTVADVLRQLAESRDLEVLLKITYTPVTDGVIYGGIRTGDNSQLLAAIVDLLLQAPAPGINMAEFVRLTQIDEHDVVEVILPEELMKGTSQRYGIQPSRLYLTNRAGCLWFAIGNENAVSIFATECYKCEEGAGSRTPLVSFSMDTERWLNYPTEEPTGFANWLRWLDENRTEFPPSPLMVSFGQSVGKPVPLADKAAEYGGNRDMSVQLISDRNGVILKANIGEALMHYWVGRQIAWQNQMQGQVIADEVEVTEAKEEK